MLSFEVFPGSSVFALSWFITNQHTLNGKHLSYSFSLSESHLFGASLGCKKFFWVAESHLALIFYLGSGNCQGLLSQHCSSESLSPSDFPFLRQSQHCSQFRASVPTSLLFLGLLRRHFWLSIGLKAYIRSAKFSYLCHLSQNNHELDSLSPPIPVSWVKASVIVPIFEWKCLYKSPAVIGLPQHPLTTSGKDVDMCDKITQLPNSDGEFVGSQICQREELATGISVVAVFNSVSPADHLLHFLAHLWSSFLIVLLTISVASANYIAHVCPHCDEETLIPSQ